MCFFLEKRSQKQKSFGGFPNSSNHMQCLTTWSAVFLPMRTMLSPKGVQKQTHGCSCQQQTASKLSETLELSAGTNWNPPKPSEFASGTYTRTHRNPLERSGTCLRNLHHHTPGLSRTFRNLPPEPTPAHTGTLRNLPEPTPARARTLREPSGTFLQNHGTHTSTHRNPPEPSGTFLRNPHQHTGTFLQNLFLRPAPAHAGAYLGWRPH